ncbi:MAG: hemerythrin domain-containing protein [Bacteroidales bacterium]|nr:hemerythrin domain-containing protein [Bacteroidales bacterium]
MKNTSYQIITAHRKMADVLTEHSKLISIFPRLGIALGFGEKTVAQVCADNGVSLPMFLIVGNVYTMDEYLPTDDELQQCPIGDFVRYLIDSHKDYLDYKFPHIEKHLAEVVNDWNEKYKKLITNFFYDYKKEVVDHFKYEEEVVFPFIQALVHRSSTKKNAPKKGAFDKQHTNIEDKLRDFTNLLIKYIPADVAQRERIDMLEDICALSEDIEKHALIEEKILFPYIKILHEDENL